LVDSSLVEYVTQGEIYDHFLEWEQTTSIFKNQSNFPQSFSLFQNYPNPFNSETVIRYQLPASGNVELSIYNGIGQKIRTLLNSSQPSGNHSTTWDGKDDWGNPVSSGIYIYQLKVGCEFLQIKKLLLLK